MIEFKEEFREKLVNWEACQPGLDWYDAQEFNSIEELWNLANKPDWMIWLAGKAEVDTGLLVLAALDCAEVVLRFIPNGEDRPRKAIETARKFIDGKCTIDELNTAAEAAWAAARAAAEAAAEAERAAARAAAAAAAAWAAEAAAEAESEEIDFCEIVRKRIPASLMI